MEEIAAGPLSPYRNVHRDGAERPPLRGKRPAERLALAEEYGRAVRLSEERVDTGEVASIVREAAAAPNGWKVILARCAPTRRKAANSGAA